MTDHSPPTPPPDSMRVPVTEAELHAFADRQLTPERNAEIEAWLVPRPAEAARVRAWGDQKRELRALFDPVLDEAVPPTLRQAARRRVAWFRHPVAAGLALAIVAGGAGWALRGNVDKRVARAAARETSSRGAAADAGFANRAAIAHAVYTPEVRRPVEVDAEHEDQLVTWLSKRLGAAVKAPHLQAVGYALEGGRLLPGEHGPVAQFMYRDDAGHRLTLYVSNEAAAAAAGASSVATPATAPAHVDSAASGGETGFQFAREGKVNVFYWVDGPFRYAITAAADRATLARVSDEVFRQLDVARP